MDGRWRLAFLFLFIGMLAIAVDYSLAVVGSNDIQNYQGLSTANVVFLEHNLLANGTVIEGEAPFRVVDFPTYWFNENTRQLNGEISFEINDSLLLVFGDAITLKGNFGSGTGNRLYPVYALPANADQATIYTVDRTGTIGMFVNNRSVILRPGQSFVYNEKERLKDGNGTVQLLYEHQYMNRGLIDKEDLHGRMVAV
jgi:hypothetical protein